MIITRAPLRISFSGGGTDIPAFYERYGGGAVISTSINRYVYVTLNKKFDGKISIRYRIHENAENSWEIEHPLIRELLLHFGVNSGIEIVIASEVPARGSGLGASSALAVALCLALEKFTNYSKSIDKHEIAELASNIEILNCKSPIGKQDHYASALGGFNYFQFAKEEVSVTPIEKNDFLDEIEAQSMLFYLNIEHKYQDGSHSSFSGTILRDQMRNIDRDHVIYELQRQNAKEMMENIAYQVIERFMDHVNENWRIKRRLHSSISSPQIDAIIQRGYECGATAAKVCGAGGGGFVYFMVPPSMQENVRKELKEFPELKFKFDYKGAEIIFEDMENYSHVNS